MSASTYASDAETQRSSRRFTILSPNRGKRATEIFLFLFLALCIPVQAVVSGHLSYAHSNDLLLNTEGFAMGIIAWAGATFLRAAEDRGKPFYQVYGFKFGGFLFVWAFIGGYLGTNPWYTVLHGHFAFNTAFNPNNVPLFMLPMTIAVFGGYATFLGAIFRITWWGYERVRIPLVPDFVIKFLLFLPIAAIMPVLETMASTGKTYCFDDNAGEWGLNVFVYGAWHFAALPFYTSFDEKPGESQPWLSFVIKGFAVVGILLLLNQLFTDFAAPHFTTVHPNAVGINDWSVNNCLGLKPTK